MILPFSNLSYDEDSRTPSMCVLLHGALKTSSLCALVQVSSNGPKNWFGIIFSHADSKKKFCLMLALFEPGNEPVPWLGNLLRLGKEYSTIQKNESIDWPGTFLLGYSWKQPKIWWPYGKGNHFMIVVVSFKTLYLNITLQPKCLKDCIFVGWTICRVSRKYKNPMQAGEAGKMWLQDLNNGRRLDCG